jgi:hypothetical protein
VGRTAQFEPAQLIQNFLQYPILPVFIRPGHASGFKRLAKETGITVQISSHPILIPCVTRTASRMGGSIDACRSG